MMSGIDVERLKAIANFLEGQIGHQGEPNMRGIVAMNDEEAAYTVDALREYILREYALGNERANEWDILRGFFRRHGLGAKFEPKCLICERRLPASKIRIKELPNVIVCDVCRAKALTADIMINTDGEGRATAVVRIDEDGRPLSVIWRFQNNPAMLKREERVHDFDD